jgi:GNAT superfamily N-acetyltransferase
MMTHEQAMTIRHATSEDVSAIVHILRELGYSAHINAEPPTATEQRIGRNFELCTASESHTVYAAELSNGDIAGYAVVHWLPYLLLTGPEGYVSELFVRRSEQGRGIGTLLLEAVKKEGEKRGCSRLSLLNMRNRESYQRGYYKNVGWEERENAANFVLRLE